DALLDVLDRTEPKVGAAHAQLPRVAPARPFEPDLSPTMALLAETRLRVDLVTETPDLKAHVIAVGAGANKVVPNDDADERRYARRERQKRVTREGGPLFALFPVVAVLDHLSRLPVGDVLVRTSERRRDDLSHDGHALFVARNL